MDLFRGSVGDRLRRQRGIEFRVPFPQQMRGMGRQGDERRPAGAVSPDAVVSIITGAG